MVTLKDIYHARAVIGVHPRVVRACRKPSLGERLRDALCCLLERDVDQRWAGGPLAEPRRERGIGMPLEALVSLVNGSLQKDPGVH